PEVFRNRSVLWNAAETAEHWPDGLLARELVIDLPGEYSPSKWWGVIRCYAYAYLVKRGMIVDFSIHLPELAGKHSSPHAHLLMTVRKAAPSGFTSIENSWRDALHDPALKEAWSKAFAHARYSDNN
ncbi:MAG: MobA/MobL family protein, partial [Alphaproteobacteria bacterium]|nr:MobA/MobL family protein [Alphaproteobacteria bacterium]